MALELLFPHFDELIRTPEDVQRLNEAILQLAVQGKLVPQDPRDEPAEELLKRIDQPKALLPPIETREAPFATPRGWEWVKLGNLADVVSGVTLGRNLANYETVSLPYLRVANVQRGYLDLAEIKMVEVKTDEKDKYLLQEGDLLLTEGGDSDKLGRAAIWHEQIPICIHQNHIFRARPLGAAPAEWLMLCTNSPYGRDYFLGSSKKTTNLASINSTQLKNCPIALPPIAEQQRILTKVDDLFAQTSTLEARLRQAQADVVTANRAALHRLHSAQDEEQFQAAWRTIRDHFDVLYDDPRNVAELRQAILDLAVRGKLVAQDPNDEPAEELLKRINEHKNGDMERKKSSRPSLGAQKGVIPYEIAVSWIWAQFSDVANIATNSTDPGLFPNLPHIAPDNIEKFTGKLLAYQTVSEDGVSSVNHHFFPGQILYSKIRPNLSKAVLIDFEGLCSADMYPIQSLIDPRYLHLYILSSIFLSVVTRTDTRVAMPKINQEALSKVPVAVPPLAEQQRIVAKVDQLMRLCDALEAGLAQAESQRRKLVSAVLQVV